MELLNEIIKLHDSIVILDKNSKSLNSKSHCLPGLLLNTQVTFSFFLFMLFSFVLCPTFLEYSNLNQCHFLTTFV